MKKTINLEELSQKIPTLDLTLLVLRIGIGLLMLVHGMQNYRCYLAELLNFPPLWE